MKIYMIRVKGNEASELYANYCAKSWTDAGFEINFYDAVTPADLDKQEAKIRFGRKSEPARYLTETEKACYYSQYNLWKQCSDEQVPYLILEHDAYLEKPEYIEFIDRFDVQYLGQHAMEAVLFHPRFADRLMRFHVNSSVAGPMRTVDWLLGVISGGPQSRVGRPHARFLGLDAPVKSVIDPLLGTTIGHDVATTTNRLEKEKDLFKIVSL